MFANFIYFIVALLIYATHQPSDTSNFTLSNSVFLGIFLIIIFTGITRFQFKNLKSRMELQSVSQIDEKFSVLLRQQSILALLFFAIDIYGLNLSSFLTQVRLFNLFPTIEAVLFIILFILYLSIVWASAHDVYQHLYRSNIKKRSYILSNISFALPVLLPWILLSIIVDVVHILPFSYPKQILATTQGEAFFFLIFLVAVSVVGPLLIQKFWRCQPLEQGVHRTRIENICRAAKVRYRDILHWPIFEGRIITAGVMGILGRFRYILVTQALLNLLNPSEMEAVMAHEIGHVKKKHLLFYLIFFMGYLVISFSLFNLVIYVVILVEPMIDFVNRLGVSPSSMLSVISSLAIIMAFLIYFRFIFGYFMRNFERQADTHVYSMFDSAKPLIDTLKKIAMTSRQSADKPNWHHFSIKERIDFLLQCEIDRTSIAIHSRKVKKSILIYIMGLVILGVCGYQLNYGETGRVLNAHFLERVITRQIEETPKNAYLYTLLGDLYYEQGLYESAAKAYQKAIQIDGNNARALNNLAWLYATCENESLRRPKEALALAERAAAIEAAPHILDTLAESYYVNGRIKEALETERRALQIAKKDINYYEGQIKKIQEALRN
jgi:Zn-dependent protease with chaperone function